MPPYRHAWVCLPPIDVYVLLQLCWLCLGWRQTLSRNHLAKLYLILFAKSVGNWQESEIKVFSQDSCQERTFFLLFLTTPLIKNLQFRPPADFAAILHIWMNSLLQHDSAKGLGAT